MHVTPLLYIEALGSTLVYLTSELHLFCCFASRNLIVSCFYYAHCRLQGMVAFMSRMPTFRRRFRNLVKVLYLEALETGASGNQIGEISKYKHSGRKWSKESTSERGQTAIDNGRQRVGDSVDMV